MSKLVKDIIDVCLKEDLRKVLQKIRDKKELEEDLSGRALQSRIMDIAKANKIADPNKIFYGKTIDVGGSRYTIKKGDTLTSIAKNFSGAGKTARTPAPRTAAPATAAPRTAAPAAPATAAPRTAAPAAPATAAPRTAAPATAAPRTAAPSAAYDKTIPGADERRPSGQFEPPKATKSSPETTSFKVGDPTPAWTYQGDMATRKSPAFSRGVENPKAATKDNMTPTETPGSSFTPTSADTMNFPAPARESPQQKADREYNAPKQVPSADQAKREAETKNKATMNESFVNVGSNKYRII